MYNHKIQRVIEDTKYHYVLDIPKTDNEYIYGKEDLFAVIIILKHLLRKDDFTLLLNEISYEIDVLAGKLNVIPIAKVLDRMGFPENWEDIQNIKKRVE